MFSDFASQSNWSAWWPPLISLLTACHCGWIWALLSEYNGSDDVHIDECNHMTPPLLAISICSMASMLLMTPLRYRQSSLQLFGALMIFIVFTALTLIAILVTISCAIWLATSIPSADASPLCGQRLVATSILTVILSLLLSVFWLVCLFKMTYWRILFLKPPTHAYDNTGSIRWVRTYKRGYFIPTIMYHYHRRSADDNHDPFTLLYSHGNAVDLRDMQYTLSQIADSLGCNVFSYEFVGYGPSGGPVSEDNCYESLHTAYRELRNHYSIPTNRIVLWGRSLGTGPTVQVAAELGLDIAGIILESPLRSIVRTIIPYNCATCWCDVFANQDKVGLIRVPVHIEHGTDDIVVPTAHGQYLHDKLGALSWEPRWWPGVDHNKLPCGVWYVKGRTVEPEGRMSMDELKTMEAKVESIDTKHMKGKGKSGLTDMDRNNLDFEHTRLIYDFFAHLRTLSTNGVSANVATSSPYDELVIASSHIALEEKKRSESHRATHGPQQPQSHTITVINSTDANTNNGHMHATNDHQNHHHQNGHQPHQRNYESVAMSSVLIGMTTTNGTGEMAPSTTTTPDVAPLPATATTLTLPPTQPSTVVAVSPNMIVATSPPGVSGVSSLLSPSSSLVSPSTASTGSAANAPHANADDVGNGNGNESTLWPVTSPTTPSVHHTNTYTEAPSASTASAGSALVPTGAPSSTFVATTAASAPRIVTTGATNTAQSSPLVSPSSTPTLGPLSLAMTPSLLSPRSPSTPSALALALGNVIIHPPPTQTAAAGDGDVVEIAWTIDNGDDDNDNDHDE